MRQFKLESGRMVDARQCVACIVRKYPGIRESAEYEGVTDYIIERTMSCDKQEQVGWMEHYMGQALYKAGQAYRIQNANSREGLKYEMAVQFIAAYDLI